jgi:hypothetical protein
MPPGAVPSLRVRARSDGAFVLYWSGPDEGSGISSSPGASWGHASRRHAFPIASRVIERSAPRATSAMSF